MARYWLAKSLPKNAIGMEVGAWMGGFTATLLNITKPKILYIVDPWEYRPERKTEWYGISIGGQEAMDKIARDYRERFGRHKAVRIHRERSQRFLPTIPDAHLDWIYIDGDHHYKSVKQDLVEAVRIVRVGGFICGDDYIQGHRWWGRTVVRAVMEVLRTYTLEVVAIKKRQFIIMKTGD